MELKDKLLKGDKIKDIETKVDVTEAEFLSVAQDAVPLTTVIASAGNLGEKFDMLEEINERMPERIIFLYLESMTVLRRKVGKMVT